MRLVTVLLYRNANYRSTESELDNVRNEGYEKKRGVNWTLIPVHSVILRGGTELRPGKIKLRSYLALWFSFIQSVIPTRSQLILKVFPARDTLL